MGEFFAFLIYYSPHLLVGLWLGLKVGRSVDAYCTEQEQAATAREKQAEYDEVFS